ncbi:MAG: TetR/AcrR family transcriptional regulator [Lachnospiraceae bacterium]|nr:TetR/AcrR family transcriptional regulator [Lachnospiraceae bacterium]
MLATIRLIFISGMEEDMSTKERILDAALTLFAESGYDGTSVEQIANAVGIKAPSLYKHFKGKENILNALIDSAETRYEEMFGSERNIGKIPESREEFIKVTMGRVAFTMHDPIIRKTRMFLVQEQFRNERISEVTTRHQLDGVQKMFARIIKEMMEKGIVKDDDPSLLAVELTAPAVLLIAQADRQTQFEKELLESIEGHVRHFCNVYMR